MTVDREVSALRWKSIRSTGHVAVVDQPADGLMMRTTRRFLRETVEEFARLSAEYCDAVGEMTFTYHERQVHSVLLPTIARVSDAVMAEHPIRRARSGETARAVSQSGWVDYWVLCGSTVFLVELKHVFRGATERQAAQRLNAPWETALSQIGSIPDEEALDLATADKKVVKLALLVMPAYRNSASIDRLSPMGRDMALEAHLATCSTMEPEPQWSAVWSVHPRLQRPYQVANGTWEIYPWVSFVAAVCPVERD
jgi:hypothetical protein